MNKKSSQEVVKEDAMFHAGSSHQDSDVHRSCGLSRGSIAHMWYIFPFLPDGSCGHRYQ